MVYSLAPLAKSVLSLYSAGICFKPAADRPYKSIGWTRGGSRGIIYPLDRVMIRSPHSSKPGANSISKFISKCDILRL